MREICYCGREGELEEREPVLDAKGRWLTEETALVVWGEASTGGSARDRVGRVFARLERGEHGWTSCES
jgi:hypothetical protein